MAENLHNLSPKNLLGAILAILLIHGCGEMQTKWTADLDFLGPGDYRVESMSCVKDAIYVTGTFQPGPGRTRCFAAGYDSEGTLVWHDTIEAPEIGSTRGKTVIAVPRLDETLAAQTEIYVLTEAYGGQEGARQQAILTKYDTTGDIEWRHAVTDHDGPLTATLLSDAEGSVYVAGCERDRADMPTFYIGKYDGSGKKSWFAKYYTELFDYDELKFDIGQPASIVAAGVLKPDAEIFFLRCDRYGIFQRITRYAGGDGAIDLAGVVAGPDGAVYLSATVFDDAGRADLLTLAYDRDNNLLWAKRHDGAAQRDDYAGAITVDDSSNVYVTGSSENTEGVAQVSTVKYDREGDLVWIAALEEKEPVEPLTVQPAYLRLGKQQEPSYLYIAAAIENSAALIRCSTKGFYSGRATHGMRGKVCRPTALSGKCLALECISDNAVEAHLVKFGPSAIMGIARWD